MPLNFDSLPLREIRKGRELRWNPHEINLESDRHDWPRLDDREQQLLLNQVFGFLIGERAVTHDLAPLQLALRREKGHMDEEMYLTQQLFEESTHVEFFQRWLFEVLPGELGADVPYPPGKPTPLLSELLPAAMQNLLDDPSPPAQMRAVVTYHQLVEGVSAEVGYRIFYDCLDYRRVFPGLRQGLRNIQRDESRHIAFGTYLAQRLIRDHPDLKQVFLDEMELHKPMVTQSTGMLFDYYDEPYPFGLDREEMLRFTEELHRRRIDAVVKQGLVPAEP